MSNLTVREAFALAGHEIPEDADYYYMVSKTKFMVFSSYAQTSWMFGPGVGVMDESWFLDSWYQVTMSYWKPLKLLVDGVVDEIPDTVRSHPEVIRQLK